MNNNYIPLYRKYRPQTLEQIVGQEHIKKALTNAIELNKIAHAYLFTGPRGTGKTSSARIFAKSLNCKNGPTVTPCGECENCVNITKSIPIDVIEIDAASNRSVNDAEEIIQNVAMAPVHSRYKIYIIDEVHMLTPTAFNALLKTLEEPPENVIFILATTEVHKVLDTIKSRCQRFDFKRITTDDISKHLRFIADKEKINITDEALCYIAQNSAGGMRDSIALLDQLSVLNDTKDAISVEDINRLLGRLSFDDLNKLFKAIVKSDSDNALEILNGIYNQGNEPTQILSNFLEFLRNALIIKSTGGKTSVIQLNDEQIKNLDLSQIEKHQLVSLIDKCASYIKELKLTSNPKLWLDVAVLDMANLTENTKLADLQERLSLLEAGNHVKTISHSTYNTPPMPVKKMETPKPAVTPAPAGPEPKTQETPKQESQGSSADIKNLWINFLNNISSTPSRTILKQQALPVKLGEDEIIISIKNQTWLKNFSPDGARYAFLVEAAKVTFNTEPKIIVRAPLAGDDKIAQTAQQTPPPKKPLIPPKTETKEEIVSALEANEEAKDLSTPESEDEKKTKNLTSSGKTLSLSEAAYHSDNVNMVMDLFEGKIIE